MRRINMRIAIDITEAINGWRLDIIEDGKAIYRENFTQKTDVYKYLYRHVLTELAKNPNIIRTMDVI